jgi:hypothetical protein
VNARTATSMASAVPDRLGRGRGLLVQSLDHLGVVDVARPVVLAGRPRQDPGLVRALRMQHHGPGPVAGEDCGG